MTLDKLKKELDYILDDTFENGKRDEDVEDLLLDFINEVEIYKLVKKIRE